ncbi:MAG: Zn-dependent hydrolase, glyoxylase [Firmicutes bacterium]|nr:Zn-dependent hydrolase, glyoxylase [Bacillota bacterium]
MPEQILPGIYRMEIPIPNNPLKATNAYCLKSSDRTIIVDPGIYCSEALGAITEQLAELSVDLTKTDFIITHMHADHCGLVAEIQSPMSITYISEPDAIIFENSHTSYWNILPDRLYQNGFSTLEAQQAVESHPGKKGLSRVPKNLRLITKESVITIGNYSFTTIATPGHTPGHICLYEPHKKILIAGDHLLGDISPNITYWADIGNPLGDFIKSLTEIADLSVDLVLPGHRRIFTSCRKRANELISHHQQRLSEIEKILTGSQLTAYQVAGQMTWDMRLSWEDFPPPQKLFATGEALAHLRHLELTGRVTHKIVGQHITYSLYAGG